MGKAEAMCVLDWKRLGLRVGVLEESSSSMSTRGGGLLKDEIGVRLIRTCCMAMNVD